MRGADTFTESLFTMRRLDDFVPGSHPLRPVRKMVNMALKSIEPQLSSMYAADIKGGSSSIAQGKLLRAMLLQIFYSIRSERLLMEQTQYNLLFRWFIALSLDDMVWVPIVFTKNRERLIAHDAVIELFNEALAIATKNEWLSGEHFSVDGTLIQALAGHKSFARKDGSDDDTGNFKGKKRSNDTHESTTDADARFYQKGKTGSELRFMGHTLSDNRHGLIASAVVTTADGYAEREAAKVMITDAKQVPHEKAQSRIFHSRGWRGRLCRPVIQQPAGRGCRHLGSGATGDLYRGPAGGWGLDADKGQGVAPKLRTSASWFRYGKALLRPMRPNLTTMMLSQICAVTHRPLVMKITAMSVFARNLRTPN